MEQEDEADRDGPQALEIGAEPFALRGRPSPFAAPCRRAVGGVARPGVGGVAGSAGGT